MAYQNVPVQDGTQIVQEIVNFAQGIGWTIHHSGSVPFGEDDPERYETEIQATLSAPGYPGFISMGGKTSGVYLNAHRSYDSGMRWWEQPDQYLKYDSSSTSSYFNSDEQFTLAFCELRVTPTMSVHLFGGMTPTPYVYAAVEVEPGYYRHITIGHLQKFGAALGGLFWDVSSRDRWYSGQTVPWNNRPPFMYNSNAGQHDYDYVGGCDSQTASGAPAFYRFGDDNYNPYSYGGHFGSEADTFYQTNPIIFNSRTTLQTPLIFVKDDRWIPFGTPPAFRYVSMEYFEAGDELTIGQDVWKIFPWVRRIYGERVGNNSNYYGSDYEATHMYGLAYLKD